MFEVMKLSLSLFILLILNATNIQASSFSEIELIETNEIEEIDFSFCFNEHYNDSDIVYLQAHQITQCFFNSSQQLYQLYCKSSASHLLNDLISGFEYTLSWLNRLAHYPQAEPKLIAKQTKNIEKLLYFAANDISRLCQQNSQ